MADKSQIYNILVPETYVDGNGEEKTFYHRAGVAFSNKAGGFNGRLPAGLALTGEFIVMPRRDRAAGGGQGAEDGDEIPL